MSHPVSHATLPRVSGGDGRVLPPCLPLCLTLLSPVFQVVTTGFSPRVSRYSSPCLTLLSPVFQAVTAGFSPLSPPVSHAPLPRVSGSDGRVLPLCLTLLFPVFQVVTAGFSPRVSRSSLPCFRR